MATKRALELAEQAMPGWKAVVGQADSKKSKPVRVDAGALDVQALREKYFGSPATVAAKDGAKDAGADGEIVTLESTVGGAGPKKLRVLVANGRVTGLQG